MQQIASTKKDYSILRKVQLAHTHSVYRESTFTLGRTTSYESSQFCKSFDLMAFRRASTKEEINAENDSKNPLPNDAKFAIRNLSSIKSPCHQMEMDPLQMRVWKTLSKQSLQCVYLIDIIVLFQQDEYEFKFDISDLSCFLTVKELSTLVHLSFQENKFTELRNPYLSILIGRVKTQKLDGNMRLFELANILLNSQKTLILQDNSQQF